MSSPESKLESAVRDIELRGIESEEECMRKCQDNFCYAFVFESKEKLCKCIYCTGFIRD